MEIKGKYVNVDGTKFFVTTEAEEKAEKLLKKLQKNNDQRLVSIFLPNGQMITFMMSKELPKEHEIELKKILSVFMNVKCGVILTFDENFAPMMFSKDLREIPEEAVELFLLATVQGLETYEGNPYIRVFELLREDFGDLFALGFAEYMFRNEGKDVEFLEDIKDETREKAVEAYKVLGMIDIHGVYEVFDDAFYLKAMYFIDTKEKQMEELKSFNLSMNDKFMANKIKKSIKNQEGLVEIGICFGMDNHVSTIFIKDEETLDYFSSKLVYEETALLTAIMKRDDSIFVKTLGKYPDGTISSFKDDNVPAPEGWIHEDWEL